MKKIKEFVTDFKAQGFYPTFHTITDGVNKPVCKVGGREYLMFGSNNYLGLTHDERVKSAAKASIDKYGVGPGGSRVISGNVDIIETLESKIAALTKTEDCLTFPTGYMANVAVFRALMDPLIENGPYPSQQSLILSDEYNHGSIIDGCRLSSAKKVVFKHNNLDSLRDALEQGRSYKHILVVTEGVFSLEGEILPLDKYVELVRSYGAKLMVDDAHGVGIIGTQGGGVGDLYNLSSEIDVLMGCMDKAMGGTGGYLCGEKHLIDYLRIASRSSLLSSSIPTMMAGAMIESTERIVNGSDLRKVLFEKAKHLKSSLCAEGFTILGKDDLPAIALYLGDERNGLAFSQSLFEHGVYCPLVRWPAVPAGGSRLRIIVMVDHSYDQLDKFVEVCKKAREQIRGN